MSFILITRKSCWPEPDLRQLSVASFRCLPLAHVVMSTGDALVVAMVKWKSCVCTFPAPAPPPGVPTLLSPQLNDETSISPGCSLWALLPSIPSIFRNASKAMPYLQSRECEMKLGRAVAAQLAWLLAGDVAPG